MDRLSTHTRNKKPLTERKSRNCTSSTQKETFGFTLSASMMMGYSRRRSIGCSKRCSAKAHRTEAERRNRLNKEPLWNAGPRGLFLPRLSFGSGLVRSGRVRRSHQSSTDGRSKISPEMPYADTKLVLCDWVPDGPDRWSITTERSERFPSIRRRI